MQPSGSISPATLHLAGRTALLQVPLRFRGQHGRGESHAGTTPGAGELLKRPCLPSHKAACSGAEAKKIFTSDLCFS